MGRPASLRTEVLLKSLSQLRDANKTHGVMDLRHKERSGMEGSTPRPSGRVYCNTLCDFNLTHPSTE